jgi:cyanophycinase
MLLSAVRVVAQETPEYGPAKGTLLIAGGNVKDAAIFNRFIELAGGPQAKVVVVPTAGGNKAKDGSLRIYDAESV